MTGIKSQCVYSPREAPIGVLTLDFGFVQPAPAHDRPCLFPPLSERIGVTIRDAFSAGTPAIVLAEGEFGESNGKTANGVVMHSELFDAVAVVDSTVAGRSVGDVLGRDDVADVPVVESVADALEIAPEASVLLVGVAPPGGALPESMIHEIEQAIEAGCDVVSGLHRFLTESERWRALAAEHDITLFDVRQPPDPSTLQIGTGRAEDVDADVVLVAGTDCAVGKRTTTFELYREARDRGIDAKWVATGQTGIMVGAHEGVVVDRVPADFVAGVVESLVLNAAESADLVFVEGQAALTHRSYGGVALGILQGSWPDATVVVDDPNRDERAMGRFEVPSVDRERAILEELSETTVAAVSTWEPQSTMVDRAGLPTGNVYRDGGTATILDAVSAEL